MAQRNIHPVLDETGQSTPAQRERRASEAERELPIEVTGLRKKDDLQYQSLRYRERDTQSVPGVIRNIREQSTRSAIHTRETAQAAYEIASARARETYETFKESSAAWIEGSRAKAIRMKDDHPLELLAILGGTFFLVGAFLRVWRSSHAGE